MTGLRPGNVSAVFSTGLGIDVPIDVDGAGTPVVDVPRDRWHSAAELARDVLLLDFADWLSAVDMPDGEQRGSGSNGIDVVLHVADSTGITRRLMMRTRVPDADLTLASLTDVWPGLAWHERETAEMFGLDLTGFDDGSGEGLRPLLLPDGFEGTPLRKSFLLAARAVRPWPGAKEPGESDAAPTAGAAVGAVAPIRTRRRLLPPGVPDPDTWARPAQTPAAEVPAAEVPAAEAAGSDGGATP